MLQPSSPATNVGGVPGGTLTIQSRFGEVVVDMAKSLEFPRGLLGMADKLRFALAGFPSEKMQQFMLLQSLDETALSFITLPLPLDNPIVAAKDIYEVSRELQIAEDNLALLLIVSVHRFPTGVKLSVNARAPLFIDSLRKLGVQHVFQHDTYKVQHML
jgi:flagellar assembly factor FliW